MTLNETQKELEKARRQAVEECTTADIWWSNHPEYYQRTVSNALRSVRYWRSVVNFMTNTVC